MAEKSKRAGAHIIGTPIAPEYMIGPLATKILIQDAKKNPHVVAGRVVTIDMAYERDFFEVETMRIDQGDSMPVRISLQHEGNRILAYCALSPGVSLSDCETTFSEEHLPASVWNALTSNDHVDKELSEFVKINGIDFDPVITDHNTEYMMAEHTFHLRHDAPDLPWSEVRAELLSMASE